MSDQRRKRGRPRTTPVISYEAEMKMRNNTPRNIKKPKYLLEGEGGGEGSSTPSTGSFYKGYNADIDKNCEFHYGSDFETEGDDESEASAMSDEEGVISETETPGWDTPVCAALSTNTTLTRPITPDAVWLQDRTLPILHLPPSADDLLLPLEYFMPSLGVYEVLRHFSTLLRLSPFR